MIQRRYGRPSADQAGAAQRRARGFRENVNHARRRARLLPAPLLLRHGARFMAAGTISRIMAHRPRNLPVNVSPPAPATIPRRAARRRCRSAPCRAVAGAAPGCGGDAGPGLAGGLAETGYQAPTPPPAPCAPAAPAPSGFLIPDMATGVLARRHRAEAVLSAAGYMPVRLSSNRSPARESPSSRAAQQRQMDGLIVTLADETHELVNERLGTGSACRW